MDTNHQQQRRKYDRITQLEERLDYLEGAIYQIFQLLEQLLKTVEYRTVEYRHDDETAQRHVDTARENPHTV